MYACAMKILVVEDEPMIASFIEKGLRESGCTVRLAQDGDTGYGLACGESFDAIVLDIMLPGRDGLSILKRLREKGSPVPILILSARGELPEKLEGMQLGADDYLTKPFFIEELIARLHVIVRRQNREQLSSLTAGPVHVDLLTREVRAASTVVELTAREFALLEYLMRAPGRVLTRAQILEQVWHYDFDPRTNLVDVYIRRVRRKLGAAGAQVETVRGVGYRVKNG